MADRYVVAAGGNWSATGTWSTSDGGAGGASVPTASDNVYLTANSGNLNVNTTATCLDFDCAGYTGLLNGSGALTVSGTVYRLSAGMTCSRQGGVTFNATSGTCAITSNGKTLTSNTVTFNGAGGAWQLQDDFSIGLNLIITQGSFDTNGKAISAASIQSSGASTRSVDISGSTLHLSGSGVNFATTTNLTFSASGSTIYFMNTTSQLVPQLGDVAYGAVRFSARSGAAPAILYNSAGVSFESFDCAAPCVLMFGSGIAITVNTPLGLAGDSANLVSLLSSGGVQATINCPSGDSTFEWCAFSGIAFSGTGSFTATNSYNLGGVSGIAISPPSGGGASPEDIATAVWDAAPAVLDANIKQVNSVVIAGDGDGTPWGPA